MKGISTVVATILMLMITIALAGVAYMYINGVFTTQTSCNLAVNSNTTCIDSTHLSVTLENGGTSTCGAASVAVSNSTGTIWTCTTGTIGAASTGTCVVTKTAGAGYYMVVANSGVDTTPRTPVYCSV